MNFHGSVVGVTGSRSFVRSADRAAVRSLLNSKLAELAPTCIVHGGAEGPDTWAHTFAMANGIHTQVYRPAPGSGVAGLFARNRLIVDACDLLVAVWDGASSGTGSTVEYADTVGKPLVWVGNHREERCLTL